MSEPFEQKDYGEYFKALEKSLNNTEKKISNIPETREKPSEITPQKSKIRVRKSTVIVAIILVAAIIIGIVLAVAVTGKKEPKTAEIINSVPSVTDVETEEVLFPLKGNIPDITVENDAPCIIVVNRTKNKVIAARNPHTKAYPASTLKVMTLLVAAENLTNLEDAFTMSYEITDPLYKEGATITGFLSGETVPLKDMLYGIILPSGGDAAVGVAVKIAGSEKAFVEMMNQKAKELGMENTHYANATGLHNEGNYTSVYDMAILTDAAMKNDLCREILSTAKYTTTFTDKHPEGLLFESTLFSHMKGTEPETATIVGGKTGYVNMSKYCITTFGVGKQSGDEYIVVTMGNSSRWPAMNGQITLYKEYAK